MSFSYKDVLERTDRGNDSSENIMQVESEYKGVDPLLKAFFKVKQDLKTDDYKLNDLLLEPVGMQTFLNWKSGRTTPSSENRVQILELVNSYNPSKPKEIYFWKERREYRNRYEKQRERTKKTKEKPILLEKQIVKNVNNSHHFGVDSRLREIGKHYANLFDELEVNNLEKKYVAITELDDLSFYKKELEIDNEETIQNEVQKRLHQEVLFSTEILTNQIIGLQTERECLITILNEQITEIEALEKQVVALKAELRSALKYAKLTNEDTQINTPGKEIFENKVYHKGFPHKSSAISEELLNYNSKKELEREYNYIKNSEKVLNKNNMTSRIKKWFYKGFNID